MVVYIMYAIFHAHSGSISIMNINKAINTFQISSAVISEIKGQPHEF